MEQIDKLKTFCLVAQKNSFAQAAHQLGLPRSTVTHVIKSLEKEYEVLLFYRNTRHVTLTHEGELFYQEANDLVDKLSDLRFFRNGIRHQQGKIRVSLPTQLANQVLMPHLQEFYALFPQIQLVINTQDQYLNLIENELDCVVRVGEVQSDLLMARPIGHSALITLVSTGYLNQYGLPKSLSDLETHYAVDYRQELHSREDTTLVFRQQQCRVKYQVSVEDTVSYLNAGIAGLGIIQIPDFDAARYIQAGQLKQILEHIQPAEVPVNILMVERKYRPRYIQEFIQWMEQKLKMLLDPQPELSSKLRY